VERAENQVKRAWQKTMERERSVEREVVERERSGERAESADHSLLTVGGERGYRFG